MSSVRLLVPPCATVFDFSLPVIMVANRTYAGTAQCWRAKRPSIPHPEQKKIKESNEQNKENLLAEAQTVRDDYNQKVPNLAFKYGYQHSTMVNIVDGKKILGHSRAPNSKNEWISERMAELNKGEFFGLLLSFCQLMSGTGREPNDRLTLQEFQAMQGHEYTMLPPEKLEEL